MNHSSDFIRLLATLLYIFSAFIKDKHTRTNLLLGAIFLMLLAIHLK